MALDYATDVAHRRDQHLGFSYGTIASAALVALRRAPPGEPRRAIVLGAGNANDIPLSHLTDEFNQVTLVDVDPVALDRAVSSLSRRQLGRVVLTQADIDGRIGNLITDLQTTARTEPLFADFLHGATDAIAKHTRSPRPPALGSDYNLVCSHLVLSQLASLPQHFIETDIVEPKYDRQLSGRLPQSDDEVALMRAFAALDQDMGRQHIDQLAQLASPTAAVHFADTYASADLTATPPDVVPTLDDAEIQETIAARFTRAMPRMRWLWPMSPQRTFLVYAETLHKKT
jgi:hypothetical protein